LWTLSPEVLASNAQVTFFHGENDPVFRLAGVRSLAARLGATMCVLPEDGHMLLLSRPDIVDRASRLFAARDGEAGPCG
jgi:pimeloyl-ACP methyl ester carboxylesterase